MGRPASGKPLTLMPIRVDEDVRAQVQALRESHATINEGLADIFENIERARRGVNQYLEPFARTILGRYVTRGLTEKEVLSNALATYDTSRNTVKDAVLDHVAGARAMQTSSPPRTDGTFSCRCEHSGCQGSKFMGVSKFSTLCPECEAAGHRGDRHDCSECWNPA